MPGIAGALSQSRIDNPEEIISKWMSVGALKSFNYTYKQLISNEFVCLNTLTGYIPHTLEQPGWDDSGSIAVFIEGELFNKGELEAKYFPDKPTKSLPKFLANLFSINRDTFASELNGEFNIVVFNKITSTLHIFTDHLASMPLYYTMERGTFYFGSEKKYILTQIDRTPEIDPLGLLQIFAHKYNLDERTQLKNLSRVKPGVHIKVQHGNIQTSYYYKLKFNVPSESAPIREVVDEWGDQLRQATHVRLSESKKIIMSLSAGLDSRAIACSFPKDLNPRIVSRTRGELDSLEGEYAAQIANALGFQHFPDDPGAHSYSNLLPKIIWRTEGETHFLNCLSISSHSKFREMGNYIAGGWLGDVTSGGHIAADMLIPFGKDEFIKRAFKRHLTFNNAILSNIFNASFLSKNLGHLYDLFYQSFDGIEGTPLQAYEIWDLVQRQRRQTTSSMPIDSWCFEKLRPFYDKKYIEFTFTLPTKLRFGQCVYQSMIYNIGPQIRHVPSANNKRLLHPSYLGNMFVKLVTLIERSQSRMTRRFNPSYKNNIENRSVENPADLIRKDVAFREIITNFINSQWFDDSIFNREGIRTILDQHYQKQVDNSYILGYVAGHAIMMEQFFNRPRACPESTDPLDI